jgi:hypothetical protein
MDWAVKRASAARLKRRVLFFVALLLVSEVAGAPDDAVRLSWRVPDQNYYFRAQFAVLQKGNLDWYIPLWSCTPASLKIIKVLGKSPPAPYAVEITVGKNERIDAHDNVMRLHSIHFLAASLSSPRASRCGSSWKNARVIPRDS